MKHSGNVGDLLYAMPSVKAIGGGELRLELNHPAKYPHAGYHPCGMVRMTERMADMVTPLLAAQPYIGGVSVWNGEAVDIDLDRFRELGGSRQHLAERHAMLFPEVAVDLESPWLLNDADWTYRDAVVVNRTFRYRHPDMEHGWRALNDVDHRIVFLGLPDEFADFKRLVPRAEHVVTGDFLQSARIIAGCLLFAGNQSSCWAMAEGLKVPRLLERFPRCPNCDPRGANGTAANDANEFAKRVREIA